MKLTQITLFSLLLSAANLSFAASETTTPEFWRDANVYFMLTDRFNNGDKDNDVSYGRTAKPANLRGFEGGDIKGIINKIEDGYFTKLGIDAIWMTPLIEQIHGYDTSAGLTYSYHGYWPKDWTAVDANYGTEADLAKLVKTAHQHNIKVLFDVIINHTGPKTQSDWAWPSDWIRTEPLCNWKNYEQNITCALATSLTDIKTESEDDVDLPPQLVSKWKKEGRLEQEVAELNAFFKRTGYPRAPKYYIVKWLTDWVREYGVDGFRVDTAKHVEAEIWQVLKDESEIAFNTWKVNNPEQVKDSLPFYMVGEVYHWGLNGFNNTVQDSRAYDYSDRKVDFFEHGFDALINMGFVSHVSKSAEDIFSDYAYRLNDAELKGKGVLSYISSHDDHGSYDRNRETPYEVAFKLMLAPGGVQIYYGDELARRLYSESEAYGDAHLRTFMNWSDLENKETRAVLNHWQKLGKFRQQHPAVGLGKHQQLSKSPYVFKRVLDNRDKVVVAKDLKAGKKTITVKGVFKDGERVRDYYSGQNLVVKAGKVQFKSDYQYALLAQTK